MANQRLLLTKTTHFLNMLIKFSWVDFPYWLVDFSQNDFWMFFNIFLAWGIQKTLTYFYRNGHYLRDTVAVTLTSRIVWIVLGNKIDQLDTKIWYLGLRSLREDKVKLIRGSESEGSNDFEVTEFRIFHSFLPTQPTRLFSEV